MTLALEDRRRHLYIVDKTGMGKTTLIQSMIAEDIAAGRGAGKTGSGKTGTQLPFRPAAGLNVLSYRS